VISTPERWLREGPSLNELVRGIRDGRGGRRSRTAVLIPTWRRNDLVMEHLLRLSRQSQRDFDVIVVYGEEDEPLDGTFGLPCVHILRKGDIGSAGGFYVAEKFALGSGYEFIVRADNDCFPETPTLLADLLQKLDEGADVAFPRIRNMDGKEPSHNSLLPQYGCLRAGVLREVGLTYLPLHFGGEDIELLERIKKGGYRVAYADSVAYHAQHAGVSPFACGGSKMRYYMRSDILWRFLSYPPFSVYFRSFTTIFCGIFFMFSRKDLSGLMLDAAAAGSLLRFFKMDDVAGAGAAKLGGAKGMEASRWTYDNGIRDGISGKAARLAHSTAAFMAQAPEVFGRDIIFERTVGASGLMLALLARDSWLRENGGYYPVLVGNRPWHIPMHIAAAAIALAVSLPLSIALTSVGYLRKFALRVDSRAYGISKKS
jgi:GT2 family glycosyltransferase